VVGASGSGSEVLAFLGEAESQGLGVLGEIRQAHLGGQKVGAHPGGGEQGAQTGVEAKAIPAAQSALDKRTKLMDKALGNEVFRQKWGLHTPF